jgi:gluconokinase
LIVVVMGVSGSGKSTLASHLVERTGWKYAEGDEYHSESNRTKMHAGIPLTDEDRWTWLDALHVVLAGWSSEGSSGVLTCSALKETYRHRLLAGIEGARIVWLDPPRDLLEARLSARVGHFMNPKLLDSQLATLEAPEGAAVLRLAGRENSVEQAEMVIDWLRL